MIRDVEILGGALQQQVAHRAADDEGGKTSLVQLLYRFHGGMADVLAVDAVCTARKALRLMWRMRGRLFLAFEDGLQEFFDHESNGA